MPFYTLSTCHSKVSARPCCVRVELAHPAVDVDRLMKKQAYVDSTHLNNSDKGI